MGGARSRGRGDFEEARDKRAKRKIRHEMEGSFKDKFAKLEGYCEQLRRDDPGSDVILEVDDDGKKTQVFRRLYVCFNAVKVCF